MPLYEYRCLPNNHHFEVRHGVNESPVTACPECGSEIRRVIHPVGIVFKGSGFYATDSRAAAQSTAKKDEKTSSEPAGGESKSETAAGAKTESTSATKSETAAS